MFAAVAGIVPGKADIVDPAEVMIIDDAQIWARRQLDHKRSGLREIDDGTHVGRVRIAREQYVPRSTGKDECTLVIPGAGVPRSLKSRFHRHRRIEEAVGLNSTLKVLLVLHKFGCLSGRKPALELVGFGPGSVAQDKNNNRDNELADNHRFAPSANDPLHCLAPVVAVATFSTSGSAHALSKNSFLGP